MNIKRALLAASAAIMLPGLAMAQTTFPTSIVFLNGNDASINVTLTCNTGNPLVQDFDISMGNGVDFVVQDLDTTVDTTRCTIVQGDLDDGYTIDNICVFQNNEPLAIPFSETGSNECSLLAVPLPSVFVVTKAWENAGPDIFYGAEIEVGCTNAALDPEGPYLDLITFDFFAEGPGVDIEGFDFFAAPGETSVCVAYEDPNTLDSAVESDQGCLAGTEFTIGSGPAGCTITNSVFYEGIPTLSQYGMAIMALLMLSVGFVGFRRLV
jgi:hypothetical protein